MEEQRTLLRSSGLAERLATALLIPGLLRERLRELDERRVVGNVLLRTKTRNTILLARLALFCVEHARLGRYSAANGIRSDPSPYFLLWFYTTTFVVQCNYDAARHAL